MQMAKKTARLTKSVKKTGIDPKKTVQPKNTDLTSKLNEFSKPIILGAIILVLAASYLIGKYQNREDQTSYSQGEVAALVEKIDKIAVLPQGEEPTVATVTDIESLKENPFFENAKEGDKVLIYNRAKKAYLYDPMANKIVEISSINREETSPLPAVETE